MSDVVLTVNQKKFDGWTSVRINRGIEQLCGAFSLTYTDRWTGQNKPMPIRMGDACTLSIDGHVVITGHVDDNQSEFDAERKSITCTGRDKAGDLVDCSVASTPGHWTNRSLTQIASDICKPFGIPVSAHVSVGAPLKKFGIQEGETAFDAIERLCRFRGVLPVSDGAGKVLISGPGAKRVNVALVEGVNILSGSIVRSMRDRHSVYTVKGSEPGMDDSTPDQNAGPFGSARDPFVSSLRYRPLTILSETPGDASAMKKRAVWEAAVRRGRSKRARITVQGWTHPDGVWQPNQMVKITSPWLGLSGDMLIVSVDFTRDENGTRTDIELCAKEGLIPAEISEKEDAI